MTPSDPSDQNLKTPPRFSRRVVFVLGAASVATLGVAAARWYNVFAKNDAGSLSPPDAYQAAQSGDVVLVDIRRPDEWAQTGIGVGAIALDMRRKDFETALLQKVSGDRTLPIALICARGVRSRQLSHRLAEAGFSQIIDVPEGMLGSGAGPGWLDRALPVTKVHE